MKPLFVLLITAFLSTTEGAFADVSALASYSFLPRTRDLAERPVVIRFDPSDILNGPVQIIWKNGTKRFEGAQFIELPPNSQAEALVGGTVNTNYRGSDAGEALILTKLGDVVVVGQELDPVIYQLPELAFRGGETERFIVRRPLDPLNQKLLLFMSSNKQFQFVFSSLGIFKIKRELFAFPAMKIAETNGKSRLEDGDGNVLSALVKVHGHAQALTGDKLSADDREILRQDVSDEPLEKNLPQAGFAGYPTSYPILLRMGRYILVQKDADTFAIVDQQMDANLIAKIPQRNPIYVLSVTPNALLIDYPTLQYTQAFSKPKFQYLGTYGSRFKCSQHLSRNAE